MNKAGKQPRGAAGDGRDGRGGEDSDGASHCAPGPAPPRPSRVPAGALSADALPNIRLPGRLGTARPAAAQLAPGRRPVAPRGAAAAVCIARTLNKPDYFVLTPDPHAFGAPERPIAARAPAQGGRLLPVAAPPPYNTQTPSADVF